MKYILLTILFFTNLFCFAQKSILFENDDILASIEIEGNCLLKVNILNISKDTLYFHDRVFSHFPLKKHRKTLIQYGISYVQSESYIGLIRMVPETELEFKLKIKVRKSRDYYLVISYVSNFCPEFSNESTTKIKISDFDRISQKLTCPFFIENREVYFRIDSLNH